MELRRRTPRVPTTGWLGKYVIEDAPGDESAECQVLDISAIGVGLELFGEVSADLIGRRLIVQVQSPVGDSVSIRLVGQVRNTGPGPEGGTRAGLEFVGLSETERAILNVMELMQIAW